MNSEELEVMNTALLKKKKDRATTKKLKNILVVTGSLGIVLLTKNLCFELLESASSLISAFLSVLVIAASKCGIDDFDKILENLEKEINKLSGDIRNIEAKVEAKENVPTCEEKLKNNKSFNIEGEFTLIDYMSEYLANVDSFSDKEQALMELMDYVYNNLTRENYDGVTAYFASCFWKTIVDVENKDYVLKSLYPQFIASIISLGESTLGEEAMNFKYDSETGEYDAQAYLNFLVCYISSKSKTRERSFN